MIRNTVSIFFGVFPVLAMIVVLGSAGCSYDNVDPDSTANSAADTDQDRSRRVTDGAHGAK